MNLTRRFYVLNLLTVLGAVGMTLLAAIVFIAFYTKVLGQETYLDGVYKAYEVKYALNEIKSEMQTYTFEQLSNPAFKQQLTLRVRAAGSEAVLLRNGETVFATMTLNSMDVAKLQHLVENTMDQETFQLERKTYFYERLPYSLPSGAKGALVLLSPVQLNTGFYKTLGLLAAAVFILSLLLLNAWVSHRFSKAIIRPVSRLKDAAAKISEGDLDGGIAEEGEDEVRELGRTLEIMRIRLKESVYMQQKYDENRKFLVSSISHDLKTPVTSIKGYIEGIMDGVARTPEKMQEYLETARSKAELVNTLMDDLLLYSSLDLNQLPYHFEETDLFRYFEDCITDNQYEFQQAGVSLELSMELEKPVTVRIDRERFKRVVQNILDNALKYMDKPQGQVAVILRETRGSALIEIQDNGRGIPETDLPYVFDRFYRVDAARKNASGSGLGLAIAKQIVEGHEGSLWARSEPGQGTRMIISLKKSLSHGG